MHELILEIGYMPIEKDERMSESDIPEWFNRYSDYVTECDEQERDFALRCWDRKDSEVRIYADDEYVLRFSRNSLENTFKDKVTRLKGLTAKFEEILTVSDLSMIFSESSLRPKIWEIKETYDDDFGLYVYLEGYGLITFDSLIREVYCNMLREETSEVSFYIGSVFDYHY